MAQPYRNVGAVEATGAALSPTDQTGASMDYDSVAGYAQITAKASGVGASLGLRLRAVVSGVVTNLLSFAPGSIGAQFAGAISSASASASYTDTTGAFVDYDGSAYAQFGAKATGGASVGVRVWTMLAGVAKKALDIAASGLLVTMLSGSTLAAQAITATTIAATTGAYVSNAAGPTLTVNNGGNPGYIEFSKTGYTAKGSVGTLGSIEMNLAFNMNYATGIHKYYDATSNAFWYAMNPNGVYLQFAPSGLDNSGTNDIWAEGGNLYNWYSLANGNMYARGNIGAGDTPVNSARVYAKGSTTDNTALGLYATDSSGTENFKQWNDGTLYNRGNVGIGASPLSSVRLYAKGASTTSSNYALYVTDSGGTEMLTVRNDSAIGLYGVTPIARQLLATGASHTVDDVILVLQRIGIARQS